MSVLQQVQPRVALSSRSISAKLAEFIAVVLLIGSVVGAVMGLALGAMYIDWVGFAAFMNSYSEFFAPVLFGAAPMVVLVCTLRMRTVRQQPQIVNPVLQPPVQPANYFQPQVVVL